MHKFKLMHVVFDYDAHNDLIDVYTKCYEYQDTEGRSQEKSYHSFKNGLSSDLQATLADTEWYKGSLDDNTILAEQN